MMDTGASSDPAVEKRLADLLAQMYGFYHKDIDLSLDRVRRFLEKLGNPHLSLPKTIHVAGTNGKGSTIATLRSLLETAGCSVHVATSPHLVHPTERVRLAGKLISSEALVALLEECLAVNRDEPITFFEMFTAASFLAFARTPADFLLLETGMGGRLDATNVVDPACSIITMISRDHEAFLGHDLWDIAREKAGIIKPGAPCVIGYQTDEAIRAGVPDVFREVAGRSSTLVQAGAEWTCEGDERMIRFTDEDGSLDLPRPNLSGPHQIQNAGAALAAFKRVMPHRFTPEILSTALVHIDWPARLQRIENTLLNRLGPPNATIILDGGHNDSGGVTLAKQAEIWEKSDGEPLYLIVAMVNRKDAAAFLHPLVPYTESLSVTRIPDEKDSYEPDVLLDAARPLNFRNIGSFDTVEFALKDIHKRVGDTPCRILICGSLYFAGNLLRHYRPGS